MFLALTPSVPWLCMLTFDVAATMGMGVRVCVLCGCAPMASFLALGGERLCLVVSLFLRSCSVRGVYASRQELVSRVCQLQ